MQSIKQKVFKNMLYRWLPVVSHILLQLFNGLSQSILFSFAKLVGFRFSIFTGRYVIAVLMQLPVFEKYRLLFLSLFS